MKEVQKDIENFIGQKFEMTKKNVSDKKWYACLYEYFRKNYKPTNEYLKKLYHTKTVKHFYTEEEIEGFLSKYLKD